ncbi:hypothetical protein CYLTODRAFT_390109 [Cylindrobasidium torrendii FP15055 ss-10]|uniref:RlpA-like protein double-psi beta-barrel domain-containing protein n=1 Tax=Cylindrobasidium torrendii FP15055 ss-10 TaxID=1314674 RepID=A0A0D7BPX4_9AGAR|nr:hypothetical protein CYLTODRAFT_390109 [Cylindrobasidium torrendii FP15055 ss-10]
MRMNRRADTCGRTNRYTSASTSSSAAAASTEASFQAAQYVPETNSLVSSSSSTEQAYTPVPEPTTTSSSDPEPTTSSSSSDTPAYTPETTAQAAPTTSTEAAAPATTSESSSSSSSSTSGTYTGEITFYATGLGSCGITNVDTDYITAVSHELFDSYPGYDGVNPNANPLCGKKINLSLGGKTVTVTATDRCTGCAFYDLDLSPSAFDQLASQDQGRVAGATWSWA